MTISLQFLLFSAQDSYAYPTMAGSCMKKKNPVIFLTLKKLALVL